MFIRCQRVITNMHRNLLFIMFSFFICLLVIEPAFAIGGLERAPAKLAAFVIFLRSISVGVGTIAVVFSGYKIMYHAAQLKDFSHILIGGTLISAASEFTIYLVT